MVASHFPPKEPDAAPADSIVRRMTTAQMYARILASDASCNGRFFTGVLTTGIYCLPSCRARKPRCENVRFFPSVDEARAAGLRACRKCHPDDFARGADPVLEQIETLAAEARARPGDFADVKSLVKRSGYGATRLFELFRLHYHSTPADFLLRARLDAAKALLSGVGRALRPTSIVADKPRPTESIAEIAFAVGFDALSAFHENFKRLNGLTPAAYRELRDTTALTLSLPADYALPYLRRALSRDVHSVSERLVGDTYTAGVWLGDTPGVLTLRLSPAGIAVEVERDLRARSASAHGANASGGRVPPEERSPTFAAHEIVVGLLGLAKDPAPFVRTASGLGLARLVTGRPGLRISQTHSVWDGLVWSILGQQINFAFACVLKRRLTELAGVRVRGDLFAPPRPEHIAGLKADALLPLQFSRQ